MKILHFADLHLGVESYGHTDPETGLSSRLLDFLSALDQVVDYALKNKVDLILFCGDAYKTREPSQTQQREFARRISRLSSGNIPIFLLVGNHDLPNAIGRATTTEIFDTLAVKNVYVSNRPDIYCIPTSNGTVQIVSLPWPRRGALLSKEEKKNLDGFGTVQPRNNRFHPEKVLAEITEKFAVQEAEKYCGNPCHDSHCTHIGDYAAFRCFTFYNDCNYQEGKSITHIT